MAVRGQKSVHIQVSAQVYSESWYNIHADDGYVEEKLSS
jgi:hypothetical protein